MTPFIKSGWILIREPSQVRTSGHFSDSYSALLHEWGEGAVLRHRNWNKESIQIMQRILLESAVAPSMTRLKQNGVERIVSNSVPRYFSEV